MLPRLVALMCASDVILMGVEHTMVPSIQYWCTGGPHVPEFCLSLQFSLPRFLEMEGIVKRETDVLCDLYTVPCVSLSVRFSTYVL